MYLMVGLPSELLRHIYSPCFSPYSEHSLEHRIKLIPHHMHTMHQIDFQLAVSAKQVTDDCRLIGKLRKGWNDGVCHKGALICPGALVPAIGPEKVGRQSGRRKAG